MIGDCCLPSQPDSPVTLFSRPSDSLPDLQRPWHAQPLDETLTALQTDLKQGLTREEAIARLEYYGCNEIIETAGRSSWQILLDQFSNIMLVLLIGVAVVAGIMDFLSLRSGELEGGLPFKDTIAILLIVILNGILGYVQEVRAEQALASLKQMSSPRVRVLRDGQVLELDAPNLVPGDIAFIEAGTQLAADGQLAEAINLQIRESALTGESQAANKQPGLALEADTALGDRVNMVFTGTEVLQGRGTMVVTATGMATELGKIARMIQSVDDEQTPLQRRMTQLGNVLVSSFDWPLLPRDRHRL
ncbi:MAG: hypothetical protein HC838_17020 [Spirulinaceae cyanobacterium RM2_2_10]|nr:hypothetical protein [Spirulinaceae cyanobacterium RM2_2_10]